MKILVLFLFLLIHGISPAISADDNTQTAENYQYPDVWSQVFLRPNEHILKIELVTEGEAVKTKKGYKPEVFIHVKNATGDYKVGFFRHRKFGLYGLDDVQKEEIWHRQYATAYKEPTDLRELETSFYHRPISFADGSELVNDYEGSSAGYSQFPEACMWLADTKPLSRVLWRRFDFQPDKWFWQKYVIFQYHYWVEKSISPRELESEETDYCASNFEKPKGRYFNTEAKVNTILNLKDGTILVAGDRFVVRIRAKDGKTSVANPYIRIIDMKDIERYRIALEDYESKSNSLHTQDKDTGLHFWNKYFIYADELVYQTWFKNKASVARTN